MRFCFGSESGFIRKVKIGRIEPDQRFGSGAFRRALVEGRGGGRGFGKVERVGHDSSGVRSAYLSRRTHRETERRARGRSIVSLEHGHQGQGAAGLKATNGNRNEPPRHSS